MSCRDRLTYASDGHEHGISALKGHQARERNGIAMVIDSRVVHVVQQPCALAHLCVHENPPHDTEDSCDSYPNVDEGPKRKRLQEMAQALEYSTGRQANAAKFLPCGFMLVIMVVTFVLVCLRPRTVLIFEQGSVYFHNREVEDEQKKDNLDEERENVP